MKKCLIIAFLVPVFAFACTKKFFNGNSVVGASTTALPKGLRYLYVSTSGNDANDGSKNQPFLTVNKAAEVAIAGDVVVVKSGTYVPSSKITPANSGTSTNPIIYYSEVKNEAIIDGSNSVDGTKTDRRGLFDLKDKSWIIIDGLKIVNAKFWGIMGTGGSDITVKNCKTYNTGASGICIAGSTKVSVLYNDVEMACMINDKPTNTGECISLPSVVGFEIAYNTVSNRLTDPNNGGEGIDAKNACSNGSIHHNTVYDLKRVGIYIDAYKKNINNIEVYANRVYKTGGGITVASEEGGKASNIKVHDNLVYDIGTIGIRIAGYLNNGPLENIDVYHNTIYNCGNKGKWENCGLLIEASNPANFGFSIRNNIISGCPIPIKSNTSQNFPVTVDNNLFFGPIGKFSAQTTVTNTINVDPLFVNPTTLDFKLKANSPAINKAVGMPMSIKDFTDFTRDAKPDLGAIEFR